MAITPRVWKSLDTSAQGFRYLWTSPCEWNPKRKKPVYTPISKKLIPWAVSNYVVSMTTLTFCFALLFLKLFGKTNLSFIQIMMNLIFSVLFSLQISTETAMLLYGEDVVIGINVVMKLAKQLEKRKFCS